MNQVIPYDDIESWLVAYRLWKVRIRLIQVEIDYFARFEDERDRLQQDSDADPALLQWYRSMIWMLQRQRAELSIQKLRVMVVDTCFMDLSEEYRSFAELKYVEGLPNEEVQRRLALSPSTFFSQTKRDAGQLLRYAGRGRVLSAKRAAKGKEADSSFAIHR